MRYGSWRPSFCPRLDCSHGVPEKAAYGELEEPKRSRARRRPRGLLAKVDAIALHALTLLTITSSFNIQTKAPHTEPKMAKDDNTHEKAEQQQQVAARGTSTEVPTTVSKEVSTTAPKHKVDTKSKDKIADEQSDRETKRAKVKEEAAKAGTIDIDAEPEEPKLVSVSGPHQGLHGVHGPVSKVFATPGSSGGQSAQTGQIMPQINILHEWSYYSGDDLEYGPTELVVSIEKREHRAATCAGMGRHAKSDQTLMTPLSWPHRSQPVPQGMTVPISHNEACNRLDEMHRIFVIIARTRDKAQTQGISFREAAPHAAWIESMLGYAAMTLHRFGGGAATTHLYRHVEAKAQRVREVLLELREANVPAAGQGGGADGGDNESSGGQAAGSGDGDGVVGGGQE